MKSLPAAIVTTVVVALVILGSLDSVNSMPSHALVLLHDPDSTYVAPPCDPIWNEDYEKEWNARGEGTEFDAEQFLYSLALSAETARRLGYRGNRECADAGGFVQEGRSSLGDLLEAVGLLKPLPSRWNEDGTWNW